MAASSSSSSSCRPLDPSAQDFIPSSSSSSSVSVSAATATISSTDAGHGVVSSSPSSSSSSSSSSGDGSDLPDFLTVLLLDCSCLCYLCLLLSMLANILFSKHIALHLYLNSDSRFILFLCRRC